MKNTSKCLALAMAAAVIAGGITVIKLHAEDAAPAHHAFRGPVVARAIEKLGLSSEQVGQIKTELRAEKENIAGMLKRLRQTRSDLRAAIQQAGATEAAVRAASAKVADVEADLAVERAKLYGKISPILTEEQRKKVGEFWQKLDEFFDGAIKTIGQRLAQ